MLIDGAIRFAEQARDGLETRNYERSYEGFSRARAIITELIAGLNPESDPALCDRLTGLYTFLFTRLVEASSERSVEMIDEVINVLQTERETWKMLVESLALENSSAADMTEAPVMQAANNASGTSGSSLPTAGRIFTTG
jgi:flagellar protein FliS